MKAPLRQVLIILALSLAGMGLNWFIHPDPPPWNPMAVEEGEILLEDALALESVTWIDARTAEAFEAEHIPGALLLNEADWDERFEAFILNWDGQSTLVVYCDSRICTASKGVAERLRSALDTEAVHVLKGGWEAWLNRER